MHYLQGDLETQGYPGISSAMVIEGTRTVSPNPPGGNVGIAGVYPGPYYRHWDPDSPLSVRTAIASVHDKMKKDGPFDILLGLSDGGALLVSAVVHALPKGVRLPRAMLLFMPFPPFADDCTRRLDIELMPDRRSVIEVPTVLVQGDRDIWGGLVGLTTSLFVEQALDVVKWHGGHQVPSPSEREFWATIVQKLLRAYSGKRANLEI